MLRLELKATHVAGAIPPEAKGITTMPADRRSTLKLK
jgi:hypothetical protein